MAEIFYADVTLGGSINIKLHPVFQYNRGFTLRLHGYSGLSTPQGQFAFEGARQTLNVVGEIPSGAEYYEMAVPDVMLYQPKTVHCYVYVTNSASGQTIYDIVIPIIPREMPADATYTPEETKAFDKLLAQLNSAKDKMEAITEVAFAGSGLLWAGIEDEHTLVFEKAMLDDQADAYEIAKKNGFSGSRADWDAFVSDLLSHATPDQAYAAAQQASQDAEEAEATMQNLSDKMAQDMLDCKGDIMQIIAEQAEILATASEEITILPTDWTGSPDIYTATKACSIATEDNNMIVGFQGTLTEEQYQDVSHFTLTCGGQGDGTITFVAYGAKPTQTYTVGVIAFTSKEQAEGIEELKTIRFELDETDGHLYMTME